MIIGIQLLISYLSWLVIGTSRTVGSAKKFVRITSGFGGGEFTKTLRKVCTCQKLTQIKIKEQLVVIKGVDVNVHERLSNITLRYKLK
jgi:hypothetical protein